MFLSSITNHRFQKPKSFKGIFAVVSLFFVVFFNVGILAFNSVATNFTLIKYINKYGEEFLYALAKIHFWINVFYVFSYELFALWGLMWIFEKVKKKEITSLLKFLVNFCTSKQTVYLALFLEVIIFLLVVPSVMPFLPIEVFVFVSLATAFLFLIGHCFKNLKTNREG